MPVAGTKVTRSASHAAMVANPLEEAIAEGKTARGAANDDSYKLLGCFKHSGSSCLQKLLPSLHGLA